MKRTLIKMCKEIKKGVATSSNTLKSYRINALLMWIVWICTHGISAHIDRKKRQNIKEHSRIIKNKQNYGQKEEKSLTILHRKLNIWQPEP